MEERWQCRCGFTMLRGSKCANSNCGRERGPRPRNENDYFHRITVFRPTKKACLTEGSYKLYGLELETELCHLYGDEIEMGVARSLNLHRFWSLDDAKMMEESLRNKHHRTTWSCTQETCPELHNFMQQNYMTGAISFITHVEGLKPITARLFTLDTLQKSLGHVMEVRTVLMQIAKLPPNTIITLFIYEVSEVYDDTVLLNCLEKYRHVLERNNYSMRVVDLRSMTPNNLVLMIRECGISTIDAITIINHLPSV